MADSKQVDFTLFFCESDRKLALKLLERLNKIDDITGYLYNSEYTNYGYKSSEEMCKSSTYKLIYVTKALVKDKQSNILQHPAIKDILGKTEAILPIYKVSETQIPDDSPLSVLRQHSGLYVDYDDDETFSSTLKSQPDRPKEQKKDGFSVDDPEPDKDEVAIQPVYGTAESGVTKKMDETESNKTDATAKPSQSQLKEATEKMDETESNKTEATAKPSQSQLKEATEKMDETESNKTEATAKPSQSQLKQATEKMDETESNKTEATAKPSQSQLKQATEKMDETESNKTEATAKLSQSQLKGYYKLTFPGPDEGSVVEMLVKRNSLQNESDINDFQIICHKVNETEPDISKLGTPMSMIYEFLPHRYTFKEPVSVRFPLAVTGQYNVKTLTVFGSDTEESESSKWVDTSMSTDDWYSETRWLFHDDWCFMNINHFCKHIVIQRNFDTETDKVIAIRPLLYVDYNDAEKSAVLSVYFTCNCKNQHILKKVRKEAKGEVVDGQSLLLYESGGPVAVELKNYQKWNLREDSPIYKFSLEELFHFCQHDLPPPHTTFHVYHDTDQLISNTELLMVRLHQLRSINCENHCCPKLKWQPNINLEKGKKSAVVEKEWNILNITSLILHAINWAAKIPWSSMKWMINKVRSMVYQQANEECGKQINQLVNRPDRSAESQINTQHRPDFCDNKETLVKNILAIDSGANFQIQTNRFVQCSSVEDNCVIDNTQCHTNAQFGEKCSDSEETFEKQYMASNNEERDYILCYSRSIETKHRESDTSVKELYRNFSEELDGSFLDFLQPLLQFLNNDQQKLYKLAEVIGIGRHCKLNAEMLVQFWHSTYIGKYGELTWYPEFWIKLREICDQQNLHPQDLLNLAVEKQNVQKNIQFFIQKLRDTNKFLLKLNKANFITDDDYLNMRGIEDCNHMKHLIMSVVLISGVNQFKKFKEILAEEIGHGEVYSKIEKKKFSC